MIEFPQQYLANLDAIANASTSPNASDPIQTKNTDGQHANTRKASNETTAEWAHRHFQNLISLWENDEFPLTGELCTGWFDSDDEARMICTARLSGESDADFIGRHMVDATAGMAEHPPAP